MTNIVEFLTACLDKDQAGAKAAAEATCGTASYVDPGGKWRATNDGIYDDDGSRNRAFVVDGYGYLSDEIGTHMARHDPARVLREVAAKRRIMARHTGLELTPGKVICLGCGNYPGDINPAYNLDECPELRDLASVYVDRPDYQERWKP